MRARRGLSEHALARLRSACSARRSCRTSAPSAQAVVRPLARAERPVRRCRRDGSAAGAVDEKRDEALPAGEQLRLVARPRRAARARRRASRAGVGERRRLHRARRAARSTHGSARSRCSGRGSTRAPRGRVVVRLGLRSRSQAGARRTRACRSHIGAPARVAEGLLHRMERVAVAEALDRVHAPALGLQPRARGRRGPAHRRAARCRRRRRRARSRGACR